MPKQTITRCNFVKMTLLAGSDEWLDGQCFSEKPQDGVVENWDDTLGM